MTKEKPASNQPPKSGGAVAYIPLEMPMFELLREDKVSLNAFLILILLLKQCVWETGVWTGSAYRLVDSVGGKVEQRTAQRWLKDLADAGLVKSFHKPNSKADYAVLIHDYLVRFGKWKGHRLDAHATTDPKKPVYRLDSSASQASPTEGGSATQVSQKNPVSDIVRDTGVAEVDGSATSSATSSATQVSSSTPTIKDSSKREPPNPSNGVGWLEVRLTAILEKTHSDIRKRLTKKERSGLQALVAENQPSGAEKVLLAFIAEFLYRPEGLDGVKFPVSLFLDEADQHMSEVLEYLRPLAGLSPQDELKELLRMIGDEQ